MSAANVPLLDPAAVRELFDLRGAANHHSGGHYVEDPYPIWHRLRDASPVHPGTLHDLTGVVGPAMFHGLPEPDREHFTIFSYEACDAVYRNDKVFASSPDAVESGPESVGVFSSMLMMGGARHRRYRNLVQPSFVPAKMSWWIQNWVEHTVHALIDNIEPLGRAELNTDFCAAIPLLTITGSFGISVQDALEIRRNFSDPGRVISYVAPIVAARREHPQDDLISVLVQAEMTGEDGERHQLSDPEIFTFAALLLAAGSGTTWKQMGIALATLLQRPALLEQIKADRNLLRPAIEECVRWAPTDPMFSRWVTDDIDFFGTHIPKGAVVHLCIGSANRDPARWTDPDEFDITRPLKPSLGFGGGPHVCLGMHVARAEMTTGINALLDRLPDLRLDPDEHAPEFVGFYERGATQIPVVFG